MTEEILMTCPICKEKVRKVKDITDDHRDGAKCENEFYIHYRDLLFRIANPKSPLDSLRNG